MKSSPLRRTPMQPRQTPLRARSAKRTAAYAGDDGRAAFVARFLAGAPWCANCLDRAVDVHESIIRSRGGAIMPGPLAFKQGQQFFPICRWCHDWIHSHRETAEVLGFLDPRPAAQIPREA